MMSPLVQVLGTILVAGIFVTTTIGNTCPEDRICGSETCTEGQVCRFIFPPCAFNVTCPPSGRCLAKSCPTTETCDVACPQGYNCQLLPVKDCYNRDASCEQVKPYASACGKK